MARTQTGSASSAKEKEKGKEPAKEKDKSKDKNVSKRPAPSGQPESEQSPRKRGSAADAATDAQARQDAIDEAQAMVEAVDNQPTPPPSPPPPLASTADRAKAVEMNALREVAAKAAADLARVTQELERERKRNNASKAVSPVIHKLAAHQPGLEGWLRRCVVDSRGQI